MIQQKKKYKKLALKLRNYQIIANSFGFIALGFTISSTITAFTSSLYLPDSDNISLNGLVPWGFLTFLFWSVLTYWAWISKPKITTTEEGNTLDSSQSGKNY